MSVPTRAAVSIDMGAPPHVVYDLVADVTRMGEWSPECVGGAWLTDERGPGARFRGRNRRGLARWSTIAEVLVADRPRELSFATLHRELPATRWSYHLQPVEGGTHVTESFEAMHTPLLIGLAERLVLRSRQQQIEAGIQHTLTSIKAVAERQARSPGPDGSTSKPGHETS